VEKPMEFDDFRKQVKDVLEHLYDTAYLETHPLLAQFSNQATDSRLTRAQKLRSLLKETVEALRPQDGAPAGAPEWRCYLALRHQYVQGMSQGEVEGALGISRRQLQRELHKGLDAVAALLWEKRAGDSSSSLNPASPLQGELEQWEISRQSCEVQTLVQDTLWMLNPMLAERSVTLQMQVPAILAPVLVDATLTRQALFKVLRMLVRASPPGSLSLTVTEEEKQTKVVLRSQARMVLDADEDWQSAQLICEEQGTRLDTGTVEGRTEIVFGLPRASQPRVLVIDDNTAIHQLFERYLAPHHYEIIHARSGAEALQLAAEKHPDAITLDVMMPNIDGWQVLRGLGSNPTTANIPVIICSVLKEPELASSLGARAYLKKPIDRLELIATLAEVLAPADPAAVKSRSMPEGN